VTWPGPQSSQVGDLKTNSHAHEGVAVMLSWSGSLLVGRTPGRLRRRRRRVNLRVSRKARLMSGTVRGSPGTVRPTVAAAIRRADAERFPSHNTLAGIGAAATLLACQASRSRETSHKF